MQLNIVLKELSKVKTEEIENINNIKIKLAEIILSIFKNSQHKPATNKPYILIFCGVNGNGKTTSIGKLAHRYKDKKVLIAACDTFRAAAVEQLEVWAGRSGADFFKGNINADPASVAYEATKKAYDENYDYLFIDTAGRLHNKDNLMEELKKIIKVVKKIDENAPHEKTLVIDASNGQNACLQYEKFNDLIGIDSIIVTKLDGTAKAGTIISLADKYNVAIKSIGIGEAIDDIQDFDAENFIKNLLDL